MALYNMLAGIQNGQQIKQAYVFQKKNKICELVLNVLWDEGYISGYQLLVNKDIPKIKIFLKYSKEKPVIKLIKCISKPGHRIYYTLSQLWKIDSNTTFLVLSTCKGVKTLKECKKLKIGGEPLFLIN